MCEDFVSLPSIHDDVWLRSAAYQTASGEMGKDAIVAAAVRARRKFQKRRVQALMKLTAKAKEAGRNGGLTRVLHI